MGPSLKELRVYDCERMCDSLCADVKSITSTVQAVLSALVDPEEEISL